MQIRIIAVGKIKEDYLKQGIDDYKKRLSKYVSVNIQEVAEEKVSVRPNSEVKAKEAQKLQKYMPEPDSWYIVALDRQGIEVSSEELAKRVESLMIAGKSNIVFVIGGALGLDDSIIKAADFRLSLSRLTFPHQIARFIILEQLYRSFKIIRGEPYHY
ncbi:MAG: 23S rRNA (pseudouridine(1915)-N(3))-methyltransferase RlmH [Firmicutes bacterium]|nr:23S rRNA (pseudouridine(1915)-N(3))-methyltransferase RlmH [Bacillota bacterium]